MEVELTRVVVLEGHRAAVVDPVVGFDYDELRAPEEVNFPAAEPGVDLGRWWELVAGAARCLGVLRCPWPGGYGGAVGGGGL